MNLFFKSYGCRLIFFLLLALQPGFSKGFTQHWPHYSRPLIQEISLPKQYGNLPNSSFHIDRNGVIYLGKANGISILSAQGHHHLHLDGLVTISTDEHDSVYFYTDKACGRISRQPDASFRLKALAIVPETNSGKDTTLRITGLKGLEYKLNYQAEEGLIIRDGQGRLLNKISKLPGADIREIIQIQVDESGHIWVLCSYALFKISYPSALMTLDLKDCMPGKILDARRQEGGIVFATSMGLQQISRANNWSDAWHIRPLIPGRQAPIQLLSAKEGRIYAAGSEALYAIGRGPAMEIAKGRFSGLHGLSGNALIAASERGLFRFQEIDGSWKVRAIDTSLHMVHSLTPYRDMLFFLNRNKAYRLKRNLEGIRSLSYTEEIEAVDFLLRDKQLFVRGKESMAVFDAKNEQFLPCEEMDPEQHPHSLDSLARRIPLFKRLGHIIDFEAGDSLIIGYDQEKLSFLYPKLAANLLEKPSVYISELEAEAKEIRASLSSDPSILSTDLLYRHRLNPSDGHWSSWSGQQQLVIQNPAHGNLILEVQAMDLYGNLSKPETARITVPIPFFQRWYMVTAYGLILLFLLFLLRQWHLLSYRRAESLVMARMQARLDKLGREKEESDKLVSDLIPQNTARQIKSKGKSKWDKYERATVLFSDIQGFTRIAEEMNPEALIDELDQFFFHFDSVVEKYNIEKIKTIGDAYMAAGGIPKKNSTNPVEVVLAALEMQAYMKQLKLSRAEIWDLRIGIHTGPVIAGVVGHKKVSYDIWGDTVNTASRMESSGMPGKVNISGITFSMVKDYFICEYRGKLPVKYKGNIDMYFVSGLRPELAVDLKGIPNKRFYNKLQILRLNDLEEMVFGDLLSALPAYLHFHDLVHARKVYSQSFLLCRSEEIEQEDRLLVRTAAMMMFTGLTQTFSNFENRSAVICREVLPDFSYSEIQIDQICNLILATKLPFEPKNRLEGILIDTRMEYLGRPDYPEQIKKQFKELQEAGIKINGQQFKKQQLELLYEFRFFTTAASRLREVSGEEQMTLLEQERWI